MLAISSSMCHVQKRLMEVETLNTMFIWIRSYLPSLSLDDMAAHCDTRPCERGCGHMGAVHFLHQHLTSPQEWPPALFSYDNIVFSQNPIHHMWAAMQRLTRTSNYVPIGVQHGIMHWHSSCLSVSQFPRKMTRNQYKKNNQLLCVCRNQY